MIHKLQRSGNSPLLIEGELISDADGERFRGKERTRWFRVLIFRTDNDYAAQVRFFTRWEGEAEWHTAAIVRNLAQLVEWLNTCCRQPDAIGYPVGAQFETRQQRLLAELDSQYASLVSEVLNSDELDWTDLGPSANTVYDAVATLDDVFQGGDLSPLDAALDVIRSAKKGDIHAAVRTLADEYEEVPNAV